MGASVVFIIKCLISHPSIHPTRSSIRPLNQAEGRNATQQKHQERKRVFVRSSLSQPPQLLLLAVLGCSRGRLSSWPLRCLRTTPTRSSCTPSTMALSLRSLRCWSASIRTFHSAAYVVARSLAPLSPLSHLACAQKGKTPLFEACRKGRDRVAAILLAAKADPNFPDFVRTPASRSDYHAQLCERV